MAASSVSTPTRRPSTGSGSGWRAFRRPARPAPGELPRALRRSRPAAGFGAVDGCAVRPRPVQLPARRHGARLRLPDRAARSTCASTPTRGVPASELLATLDVDELTALFRRYGEEPSAGRSRAPSSRRAQPPRSRPPTTLAALVERVTPSPAPGAPRPPRDARLPGPAHRRQRGARRARSGLAAAVDLLRPGGRLVVLRYHSLEDRIVKRFLAGGAARLHLPAGGARLRLRPRAPAAPADPPSMTPSRGRGHRQPRARSARLRAAERLAA